MRNLFVMSGTGAAAWFMAKTAFSLGPSLAPTLLNNGMLGGLIVAPMALAGALVGWILTSMLYPRCS